MKKPKIIKKKKWTFEVIQYSDGSTKIHRINDGFNLYELMGIVEFTKQELFETMKGSIQPDIVERTHIKQD